MNDSHAGLEAAYCRTEYRVLLCGGTELILRIGVYQPRMDRRLRTVGVRKSWAIVTPCNPGSRRIGVRRNAMRLRQLEQRLRRSRYRYLRAANHDPSGDWPDEPGFLLCDPSRGFAVSLGRLFGQNAYVGGRLGTVPELKWLIRPDKTT